VAHVHGDFLDGVIVQSDVPLLQELKDDSEVLDGFGSTGDSAGVAILGDDFAELGTGDGVGFFIEHEVGPDALDENCEALGEVLLRVEQGLYGLRVDVLVFALDLGVDLDDLGVFLVLVVDGDDHGVDVEVVEVVALEQLLGLVGHVELVVELNEQTGVELVELEVLVHHLLRETGHVVHLVALDEPADHDVEEHLIDLVLLLADEGLEVRDHVLSALLLEQALDEGRVGDDVLVGHLREKGVRLGVVLRLQTALQVGVVGDRVRRRRLRVLHELQKLARLAEQLHLGIPLHQDRQYVSRRVLMVLL